MDQCAPDHGKMADCVHLLMKTFGHNCQIPNWTGFNTLLHRNDDVE